MSHTRSQIPEARDRIKQMAKKKEKKERNSKSKQDKNPTFRRIKARKSKTRNS